MVKFFVDQWFKVAEIISLCVKFHYELLVSLTFHNISYIEYIVLVYSKYFRADNTSLKNSVWWKNLKTSITYIEHIQSDDSKNLLCFIFLINKNKASDFIAAKVILVS